MPSYSVKEKLEALEIACRINNIPDNHKLELTNKIISSMGFEIKKPKNGKVVSRKKFIEGRLGEFIPLESLSIILGFQLSEKEFIEFAKKAAVSLGVSIVERNNGLYLENPDGVSTCFKNEFGYDKDMAIDLYEYFDVKSKPLDFGDICDNNNK